MESGVLLLPTLGFIPDLDIIWEVDETMEEAERKEGDGQFMCWGCGEFGQHCHVDQSDVSFLDSQVTHFEGYNRVKYVGCGSSHNVVITEMDEIYVWGNGNSGQLGCKVIGTKLEPTLVHLPSADHRPAPIAGVSCGGRHTMIWLKNGHVYSFGNNFYAQLGYDFKVNNYKANQLEPKLLKFLMYRHVVQVNSGDKHTVFLFNDGSIAAMGNNTHGQIGNGCREESVVPCSIDIDKPVTYIASGANHNLAITENGDVYIWGYSRGCGHRRHDVLEPQRFLEGHHVIQVAGGGSHSMALTANGNVYTWGGGMDGQLGHDKTTFISHPRKLKNSQLCGQVVYIACGEAFSAAITSEGKLYMWGKSSHTIVAGEKSSYKVYQPTCLNEASDTPVESVYCGAWHAAAVTGRNVRVLTEEESESESSDDDGTVSITSLNTLSEDSLYKNEFGESELIWEPSEMEIPVPPVFTNEAKEQIESNTRLTLGEFYAPTPDPSTRGNNSISIPSLSSGSVPDRSHDPEVGKRLVVQVPVSHFDLENSSNSTPPRSISRESSKGEETSFDNAQCYISNNDFPGAVPPHATHHGDIDKQTAKTDVPKLRIGYNRSKTMAVDNGHHTVQISKHSADKYTLPRENTKLILSKNVSFVNASDLRTTGPVFPENVSPTRNEDVLIVPNGDLQAVTIEKQRQHLTAILKQGQPQDIVVQPSGQETKIQRSKTFFAPLPGQMSRGNTRFFYKRKPSLNQLATRNAHARAQLLNPKALERMATVGWGLGGSITGAQQAKTDGPVPGDPIKRRPQFSSASSWRERRDVLANGSSNKIVPAPSNVSGKALTESKRNQLFKINTLKKEMVLASHKDVPTSGASHVPIPGSIGRRNQLIKASSLTNLTSVPKKSHISPGENSGDSSSQQTHFPDVPHSQGDCGGFDSYCQTKVQTYEKIGVDSVSHEYRPKEVASGVRTG